MLLAAQTSQRIFTVSEAARHLGVSAKTLRRWEKRTGYGGRRTKGNQRRYTKSQIVQLLKISSNTPRIKNLKTEIAQAEKLAIAATQDAFAEGLKIQSKNPNSLYSTGFFLALDTITFFARRINSHTSLHTTQTRKDLGEFLGLTKEELVQVLKLLDIFYRVSKVILPLVLLLSFQLLNNITQSVIYYPVKTVKATRQLGSTTLFTSTLLLEIAWELSKDAIRKLEKME